VAVAQLVSFACVRRLAILVLAGAAVAGCTVWPDSLVLKPAASVPASTKKGRILVATTRERGSPEDPDASTADRAKQMNFATLTISIPTQHVFGEIEWPDTSPPDPSRHFITTERDFLDANGFLKQIQARAVGCVMAPARQRALWSVMCAMCVIAPSRPYS
jgi:esterase/lipase superfamily enzyme